MTGYRYGQYLGGPDPLEPPYDVRGAVDALGESVLNGDDPASALRDLLRRGLSDHRGLDDVLRQVRERQRELRRSGRLDGILEQARALLDTAIGQERAELFPDPSDDARLREGLLNSLTDEQRDELSGLMAQAMEDAGLAQELARLAGALRARRPDIDWDGQGSERMTGRDPLGLGDATTALAELADLAELEDALRQDYPGARLDDIDEEAVRRALGRQAVDDMEALKEIERELQRQGYLTSNEGKLELTPKAVRRLGDTALRKGFAKLVESGYSDHDQREVGQAGELTGSTRPWRFGDEQAIDTAATVRNALLRGGVPGLATGGGEDLRTGGGAGAGGARGLRPGGKAPG